MPAPDVAEDAGQPRAERVADARRTIPIVPLEPLAPATAAAGPSGASVPATSPAGLGALVSYLEHDPQPMIVVDPDYRILAANGAYQRQFGGAGRAHVGRHCYRVSHHYEVPCDQAGEHCPMRAALESGAASRVLHIHHTPRGPSTWMSRCARCSTARGRWWPMSSG